MARLVLACALFAVGCAGDPPNARPPDAGSPKDFCFCGFPEVDLAGEDPNQSDYNACGDYDPSCTVFALGPSEGAPFPLQSDMPRDPSVTSSGVGRDKNGYLALDSTRSSLDWGVIANATDWSRGTLSKVDSKTTREIARYLTVACSPCGGGQNGCCSNDDTDRFAARLQNQPEPAHQPIQLADNFPSRTGLDWNGDVWVENRAPDGQASISKVANDPTTCTDRNKNGRIDTSTDVDNDGRIQTDCNADGRPDDLANVKGKPCANGKPQEFFGLDDECVLFTVNVGPPATDGRALALGPGAQDFGPSDAWAGTSGEATLYRVDGTTGIIKDRAALPFDCRPGALRVDSSSLAWTSAEGPGPLCWFSTKKTSDQGIARDPLSGPVDGRALVLDRDQNLWLADRTTAAAWRYTPDRSAGTAKLGAGYWTWVTQAGMAAGADGNAIGIAVDSRTANSYFAWLVLDSGWLVRLPASKILPAKLDQRFDATNEPALPLQGFSPIAVDVTRDSNLHVVSRAPAAVIRTLVDPNGTMTPPDLQSPAKPPNSCPSGDRCLLKDNQASDPGSDAYTDFDMWASRVESRPNGNYRYIVRGCVDQNGMRNAETKWIFMSWDADVPLNTTLTVRARAGNTPLPDNTWGAWTPDFTFSPADLINGMPLTPNMKDSSYLQLEIDFATNTKNASPRLKSIQVGFECIGGLG